MLSDGKKENWAVTQMRNLTNGESYAKHGFVGRKKHGMKHGDYFIGDDEWEMRNLFSERIVGLQ